MLQVTFYSQSLLYKIIIYAYILVQNINSDFKNRFNKKNNLLILQYRFVICVIFFYNRYFSKSQNIIHQNTTHIYQFFIDELRKSYIQYISQFPSSWSRIIETYKKTSEDVDFYRCFSRVIVHFSATQYGAKVRKYENYEQRRWSGQP